MTVIEHWALTNVGAHFKLGFELFHIDIVIRERLAEFNIIAGFFQLFQNILRNLCHDIFQNPWLQEEYCYISFLL